METESETTDKPAAEEPAVAVGDLNVDEVLNDAVDVDVDTDKDHEIEQPGAEKPEEIEENEEMSETNGPSDEQVDEESIVGDRRSIEVEFTRSNSNSNFSQQDQEQVGGDGDDSSSISDTNTNTSSRVNGNKNLVETIDIADADISMSEDSYSQMSSSGAEPKVLQKTARRKLYNFTGGLGRPTSANTHRMVKDQALYHDTRDFMMGFDPQRRNKQKRRKKYGHDGRQLIFADEFDECDCLRQNCPGCHWPCRVCGDQRCGHECRNARKWLYDTIELDGRQLEIRNHRNTSL